MSSDTESLFAVPAPPVPTPGVSKGHFDTFETKFFEQGDDGGNLAHDVERFDDLDESAKARGFAPSRRFILSVAIGSACLAVLGCIVLWRSGARASTSSAVEPAPGAPPSAPALVQAVPAKAPAPPVAATPEPEPAPAVPAVAAATPEPEPAPAVPAVAAATPEPEPTQPVPAERAVANAEAVPAPAIASSDAAAVRGKCMKAIKEKRGKEILSACAVAFAADPSAADIAVGLAKTEFDRGRSVQAMAWGKKAIAIDPNTADAYVFIGGAEQNAGHGKLAKEAYRRYLQLAPSGRYAGDLRAIVGGM